MSNKSVFRTSFVVLGASAILAAFLSLKPETTPEGLEDHGPFGSYSEIPQNYLDRAPELAASGANLSANNILFLGDSLTEDLDVRSIHPDAINFGIGGDTTFGLLTRLASYSALNAPRCIVLNIGINDLYRRSNAEILANYRFILDQIPGEPRLLVHGLLPVDWPDQNIRIRFLNLGIESLAGKRNNTYFLDAHNNLADATGRLRKELHSGDGLHLSEAGYKTWIEFLETTLKTHCSG